MGTGLMVGVPLVFMIEHLSFGLLPWIALHGALVAPTVLQPWIQRKLYKIVSRVMLGIGTTTWLLGCLWPHRTDWGAPLEVAFTVVTFLVLARLLWWMRERRTLSPCLSCPLGAYPTCSWNLPRLLAATDDPVLAEALTVSIGAGVITTLQRAEPRRG